ncbi:MAG: Rid family hydrolase, partial [Actinomycetota bacterium]
MKSPRRRSAFTDSPPFVTVGSNRAPGVRSPQGGRAVPKSVVSTGEAPQAIGPYSQGVTANRMVFCSGQIGADPDTGELVDAAVGGQT